ncbi:DUF4145 domain-containing protein [Bacillus licheniformis]|jgi:cell division protein ZapA (FtsZ GTPase activity inhibitor)|uniref:DUF4145 domain-containing protein n=2 Tax=Bacillus licheniformis TaxID=1402 RepID=A0AB37GZ94_BACLI|nr:MULTISPECIES: DUF4145 domain-containing protein [Bacillus]MBJ7886803.1 DUF4145 domain-containing protein [Bacillaceae bacterium HSR45]MBY8347473.1 DUF4145 domain-containing protein [Bacillus sp. PCH94]MDP4166868.1 DUF4145 domain-containing protein [Bacillota bacterium]AMR11472.1 hypothetical protein AB684_15240 [Bacillus licheniformis]AOP16192.1 hypothetical protein BL1202_03246 [Bacillus licheniformis]
MTVVPEKLYCRACKRKTNHQIVKNEHDNELKYSISNLDYDEEIDFQFNEDYAIVQCRGCDAIAFLKIYGDEDMFHIVGSNYHTDREYFVEYTVFPEEPKKEDPVEQLLQFKEKYEFDHLPNLINGIRNETINAYRQRMNLLCNTGIRMLIESICMVNGIDKRPKIKKGEPVLDGDKNPVMVNLNLVQKINELKEKNIIDEEQRRILLEIKDVGNQTVHEIFRPKRRDLLLYLETLDLILFNIYELPHIKITNSPSPS